MRSYRLYSSYSIFLMLTSLVTTKNSSRPLILCSILIGVAGAFSYFLQSWSIPYLILLVLTLNFLYQVDLIDPRNKAYGLNYSNKNERPLYTKEGLSQLCTKEKTDADKTNMITILERW